MAFKIPKCPQCSKRLERSHRRSFERFVGVFTRRRPHKCVHCGWRGWRRPAPPGETWYPTDE
jgi:hypothetical protein